MNCKKIFLAFMVAASYVSVQARDGFAIVIDPKSYNEAKTQVEAYASAVEQLHGMKPYIVIDRWQVPDSIRATLIRMHSQKQDPVIGAVFVGDIPVAMVRDAQHMTSAFKMDQRRDRRESSVPSDRYYDDFGLEFNSLGKDETKPYFYYSLRADSRQNLQPTIFSGRIRPTDAGGTSRYEKLRSYLSKLVEEKRRQRSLQQMFYFSGHGYISESKVARIDEKGSYLEHFPELRGRVNRIGYLDHSDHNPVKTMLMDELMRTDLDLVVLHHHGYWDTQYLNTLVKPQTVRAAKDFVTRYCREHIYEAKQRGKNADSLRVTLEKKFDLPQSWLANALDPELTKQDSLDEAASDLHLEDFKGYGFRPNVPVVVIDACFCGSFHQDDCIANEYLFQPGRTVVCIANTVNVLQDKWSDRLLGLLSNGGCVGDIARYSTYLESHVIGDPTFRFAPTNGKTLNLDHIINEDKPSVWKKLLNNDHPDIQALAIEHLFRHNLISSAKLRSIYESSPYATVRLQALEKIALMGDDNFIEVLKEASQDSHELVQRQALRLIGKSGDERLIPALIKVCISNNTSDRCNFNAITDLSVFPKDKLLAEFDLQFNSPTVCYMQKDSVRTKIRRTIERSADKWTKDTELIVNPSTTAKKRIMYIRQCRNFMAHGLIPMLIDYLPKADADSQKALLEAFGWHNYSTMVPRMIEAAKAIAADTRYDEAVRNEATKTIARLQHK